MRADALASDLRSPASAHGVGCTEMAPESSKGDQSPSVYSGPWGPFTSPQGEAGVCLCRGEHRRNRHTLCTLLPPLSSPVGCTACGQSNPHGWCLVHTWLVHALHRYTQVPNPTLSTLREDQSTRLR